jgi:colanic acid/amylovoran biosynthesis protein
VDTAFHSPTDLLSDLHGFDAVIGTRMHFCILSLLAGVPVLPIAYEFKTNELFARLGLADWVQDIGSVNADELTATFDKFWKALPGIRPVLFASVERERQSALHAVSLIK